MIKNKHGQVVLTSELIEEFAKNSGEINRMQANVLCLMWPLEARWREKITGRSIPIHKHEALLVHSRSGNTGPTAKKEPEKCPFYTGGRYSTVYLPRETDRVREWDLGSKTPNYAERDKVLGEIGFPSYDIYLKSERWEKIRKKVFATKGHHCTRCGKDVAFQIHHSSYDKDTLLGKSLDHLWPICGRCHQYIERDWRGRKKSLSDANSSLGLTRGGTAQHLSAGSRQQST